MMQYVSAESSSAVIGGLDLTTSYSITVSASTSAGEGVISAPITVDGMLFAPNMSYMCLLCGAFLYVSTNYYVLSQLCPVHYSN